MHVAKNIILITDYCHLACVQNTYHKHKIYNIERQTLRYNTKPENLKNKNIYLYVFDTELNFPELGGYVGVSIIYKYIYNKLSYNYQILLEVTHYLLSL